jgi:hypothetical protein
VPTTDPLDLCDRLLADATAIQAHRPDLVFVSVVLENSTRRDAAAKQRGSEGKFDEGWVRVDDEIRIGRRPGSAFVCRLPTPRFAGCYFQAFSAIRR